ncbi:GDNF-inducible zinc finger protein 1-like [Cydia fagiglandana]|uniref:GDNF-inducible zinc finger protein 1-like n=1 Tax=Cydia fagiglandana TaxID=1458189 RepID=UPI002FEDF495
MNCIKTESDELICRGCLSTDRRLCPLANYDMFLSLLVEKQRTEALSKPYILICWECNATLRRFQLFRGQVQRAHVALEETTLPTKNTLSCLSIRTKDKYDACFEDSQLQDENSYFINPRVDSIKHESPRNETDTDHDDIKLEKPISVCNEGLKVPPKKRKIKNKTIEKKKRKVKSEEPLLNLKVEKSKKKSKKDKIKQVEIEVCNVKKNQDKVEVKVERVSDAEENCTQDALDDEPRITDDDDDSDYGKEAKKRYKKGPSTFKKTMMEYSEDVSKYFTEVEMSEDMRSVMEKEDEIERKGKPYRCQFCGFAYKQMKSLRAHVKHRHRKAKHKDQKEADPTHTRYLYRCCYCARLVRKEHTQAHLRQYHRRRYQCLGCSWSGACFWSKKDHTYHWQKVHATLVCDICRKTRRNTRDMERHMRDNHLPIKCQQCQRMYSKYKYYRQHQKMAHPVLALEPPESRYCVECDMQCPSIMAYKMHVMNQHRNTPKKRWPCPACDKTLNNKDTMKKHYALFHSDKTSFQCPHCGKYLSSKCSLTHHLNSHLNIKLPKDKLCSICGRGFSTRRMLRFHTYTHTGERPYACAHCPAAFTQPNPLRVHHRRLHPHLPFIAPPQKPRQ